ncbi:MAG: cheB 2 [Firmicutes bacterium]|nr:cheB 2 [Bacillota bacterium]
MIKVLVVDDSAFMRKILSDLFAAEDDFTVVDAARNGKDALEKTKKYKPDVITMDVEMPIMDGIQALEAIMRETPTPVVMVSSQTRDGAEATIRALSLGAVDFIAKTSGPIGNIDGIRDDILQKCRMAANVNVKQLCLPFTVPSIVAKPAPVFGSSSISNEKIVVIGTSTGGPRALQEVITKLPGNLPCGILIVQHMPPGFTKSLADRLNSLSSLKVKEAEQNDPVSPGVVLLAPGDYHMTLERLGGKIVTRLNQQPPVGGHRPAVDPMMESAVQLYGARTVGVLLTGMGRDGAKGLQMIRQRNGYTIAEDKSTAVVFGMPKAAIELNAVNMVLPISEVAAEIVKAVIK